MSVPGSSNLMLFGGAAAYEIDQSLRFNSADSAYLNRTPGSAGNRKTWTYSVWTKLCKSANNDILSVYNSATDFCRLYFSLWAADQIALYWYNGSLAATVQSANLLRDYSAWYHLMWVVDTTQSTASNRVKLYVNGEQVTSFTSAGALNYPAQNSDMPINNNVAHNIGALSGTATLDGYLAEINFIDGSALDPSSFGETDPITGAWIPKKYGGSYGTNGFYLKFADNSGTTSTTLGKDSSGNSNNWTPNNFSVTAGAGNDVLSDTPTTNWCTWNPLKRGTNLTPSDGNLFAQMQSNASGINQSATATLYITSGKWYWEGTSFNTVSGYGQQFGIASDAFNALNSFSGTTGQTYGYSYDGSKYNGSTFSSYGSSYTSGDVVGVALDLDAGTLAFYKNGVSQGTAFTGISGTFTPYCGLTYSGGGPGFTANFGQRAFAYTPPTGYKALNTANLPEPTIKDGSDYFNTVLWTGNDTYPRAITGVGFSPDLIWIKPRSTADDHTLMDVLRGTGNLKWLSTNSTSGEGIDYNNANVTSLDSDGFTIGATGGTNQLNASTRTPVAWNWKANGAGSSNTAGSITSTVSANPSAGFSIVTYTGTGSTGGTVGHGLGVKPAFIIVKKRSATGGWVCWHQGLSGADTDKYIYLETTAAAGTTTNYWGNGVNSTTFGVWTTGGDNNTLNATIVAYCFSEVAGYSKFGNYIGTNTSDNVFVYCGFAPAWILVKASGTGGTNYDWRIYDNKRNTYNPVDNHLEANQSLAEDGDSRINPIDFLSNGFKIRESYAEVGSNTTYIFAAFAELPFKYANAR